MQVNPPFSSKVVDKNGVISPEWSGYITGRQAKNTNPWQPVFVGLTGDNAVTGFWTISERTLNFSLRLTPESSTSSVLGTTYLEIPLPSLADGSAYCFNATTKAALGPAFIEKDTKRVWLPTWSGVTAPIAISGAVQIRGQNG